MNLDHAFRVAGLSLGDLVGVFGESLDPTLADDGSIPTGSLYLQAGGTLLQKWQAPDVWIELNRWPLVFTLIRAAALDYVPVAANDGILRYRLPVAGMIVGLYCQAEAVTKGSVGIELWLNGQQHSPATIALPLSTTPVYGGQLALAASVAAGTSVQIRMADATGVASDLLVTVLFARRSG